LSKSRNRLAICQFQRSLCFFQNTALISEVDVSEAHEEELAKRSDLEVVIGKRTTGFDADGNLLPFSA
jgi:hypothetical protein